MDFEFPQYPLAALWSTARSTSASCSDWCCLSPERCVSTHQEFAENQLPGADLSSAPNIKKRRNVTARLTVEREPAEAASECIEWWESVSVYRWPLASEYVAVHNTLQTQRYVDSDNGESLWRHHSPDCSVVRYMDSVCIRVSYEMFTWISVWMTFDELSKVANASKPSLKRHGGHL
jgi:hypothetical protein